MAKSVNKATLIGNVGKDPDVRYTPNNTPVATFSLATTESWKDQSGKQSDKTEWHNLVVWGKLAEICRDYVKKGQRIYVEGKIQYRSYDDKDGVKRYVTEINVNDLVMLSPKNTGDESHDSGYTPTPQSHKPNNEGRGAEPDFSQASDDDLPF